MTIINKVSSVNYEFENGIHINVSEEDGEISVCILNVRYSEGLPSSVVTESEEDARKDYIGQLTKS